MTGPGLRRLVIPAPLVALLLLGTCSRSPAPSPHFVVGQPYQAGGIWWYPQERLDFDETGLAAVYADGHTRLTTDGEVFGQGAYAAAHPTLQLPAIARLTNLETGRTMLVRINDRGTPTPGRLVQVTRRVADALGIPRQSVAQVRLTVQAGASQAAADRVGGAPRLPIAAAPRGDVQTAALEPPAGIRAEAAHAPPPVRDTPDPFALPERVSEAVTQEAPHPGRLFVRLDTFQSYEYAAIQRAKLSSLGARIESVFEGRVHMFRVVIGPLGSVAQADGVLGQAIRAGAPDAQIVVE